MCKGGSGSSSSSTSIDPTVKQNYQNVVGTAQQAASTPYQPYQGQQVAGFSPDQITAMQNIDQLQGTATPYLNTASQYAALGAQPIAPNLPQYNAQTLQQYQSPYTQQVVNATQNQINQNNAVQQSSLAGQAIQSGASPFGGDRAGVAAAALAGQQDLAGQQTIAGLYNQGFQNAQTQLGTQQNLQLQAGTADAYRAEQAAQQFGQLGTASLATNLTAAQAQLQSGTLQQQQQQSQLNVPYQNYLNSQLYPFQTTGWLSNIVEGLGNQGGSTQSTPAQPSIGSQVAGGAATTIGLLGATGAFGGSGGGSGWLSDLFSKDGGAIGLDRVRDAMNSGGLDRMQDSALADQRQGEVYYLSGLSGIPGLEPMADGGALHMRRGGLEGFAEGGGPGSGSHDSNHDGGGDSDGGGGNRGGTSGGGPHSAGGAGAGQSGGVGNAGKGGSPSGGGGGVGGGGGTGTTAAGGPSSPEGGFGGGERGSPAGRAGTGPAGGGPSSDAGAELGGMIGGLFGGMMDPSSPGMTQHQIAGQLNGLGPMASPNVSMGTQTNVSPDQAAQDEKSQMDNPSPGEISGSYGSVDSGQKALKAANMALNNLGVNYSPNITGVSTMNPDGTVNTVGTVDRVSVDPAKAALSAAGMIPGPVGIAASLAGLGYGVAKSTGLTTGVHNVGVSIDHDGGVGDPDSGGSQAAAHGGTGAAGAGGGAQNGVGALGGLQLSPSAIPGGSQTGFGVPASAPITTSPTAAQTLANTPSPPHGVIPFTFNGAPGYPGVQIPTMGQFPSNNYADGGVPHFADGGWSDMNLGQFLDPSTADPELDSSPQMDLTGSTVGIRYPSEDEALDTGLPNYGAPPPAATAKAAPEQSGNWLDRAASSPWMALTDVGLGILGSGSPFLGQAIGQGAQSGLQMYQNQKTQGIENAYKQQQTQNASIENQTKQMQLRAMIQYRQALANLNGGGGQDVTGGLGAPADQSAAPVDQSTVPAGNSAPADASQQPMPGLAAPAPTDQGVGLGALVAAQPQPVTADPAAAQASAVSDGSISPMISPAYYLQQFKISQAAAAAGVPGAADMAKEALTQMNAHVGENMQWGADGNIHIMPGALPAMAALKAAGASAEANAHNQSDLIFKPQIEGGVKNAQNASDLAYQPAIHAGIAGAELPYKVAEANAQPYTLGEGQTRQSQGVTVAAVPKMVDQIDTTGSVTGQKGAHYMAPVAVPVVNPGAPAVVPAAGSSQNAPTPVLQQSPTVEEAQKGAVDSYNKTDKPNYEQANQLQMRLDMMDHAFDQLQGTGYTTGTGANARLKAMKAVNSAEQAVGLSPSFDTSKIASWEDLSKETTRAGFDLANKMGSREAVAIVQSATSAVPGAENTPMGAKLVSSSLRQAAQRQKDYYNYQTDIINKGGSLVGADVTFNSQNPPELYAKRAIAGVVPQADVDMLKAGKGTPAQFDAVYGKGMSNFVLGQ